MTGDMVSCDVTAKRIRQGLNLLTTTITFIFKLKLFQA